MFVLWQVNTLNWTQPRIHSNMTQFSCRYAIATLGMHSHTQSHGLKTTLGRTVKASWNGSLLMAMSCQHWTLPSVLLNAIVTIQLFRPVVSCSSSPDILSIKVYSNKVLTNTVMCSRQRLMEWLLAVHLSRIFSGLYISGVCNRAEAWTAENQDRELGRVLRESSLYRLRVWEER